MRASTISWGLTLATLALAGCPSTTFTSDLEQLQFEEPGLTTDAFGGFDNTGPLLAGTAICPAVECTGTCPDGWEASAVAAECFAQTIEGDATLEDGCLWLEGAGDTTWQFDPTPCDASDDGYAPEADQVSFRVVDPAALAGRLDQWPEDVALG